MLPVIDYLERSRPADVVSLHIPKIKQLRSVTGDIRKNSATNIHHGGDVR
jgi:hypothetical protein